MTATLPEKKKISYLLLDPGYTGRIPKYIKQIIKSLMVG